MVKNNKLLVSFTRRITIIFSREFRLISEWITLKDHEFCRSISLHDRLWNALKMSDWQSVPRYSYPYMSSSCSPITGLLEENGLPYIKLNATAFSGIILIGHISEEQGILFFYRVHYTGKQEMPHKQSSNSIIPTVCPTNVKCCSPQWR